MLQYVLIDSNVLLDIGTEDPQWFDWSSRQIEYWGERTTLLINPIIYAEVSAYAGSMTQVDDALGTLLIQRADLPWDAAFLAGKAFVEYRKRGGAKTSPLPDFYIGAHAQVADLSLLTRDQRRYRTYFPGIHLIVPDVSAT